MIHRSAGLAALRDEFPFDIADVGEPIDRFVLVEASISGNPERYITTHESPEDAAAYHDGQDHPEEWAIEVLVDLDTGARLSPNTVTTWTQPPEDPS